MSNANISEVINSMNIYEKVILYGAGVFGKNLKTKMKMQKLLFFCIQALPEIFSDHLIFEAHKKGPYSQELEELMVYMEYKGLINLPDCSPTKTGYEVYAHIILKEPLKSVVENYKKFVINLKENELLTFIYVSFPEYLENSAEWKMLNRLRVETAASMLKKQVISFSKALEISDLDSELFIRYLNNKKIRWRET